MSKRSPGLHSRGDWKPIVKKIKANSSPSTTIGKFLKNHLCLTTEMIKNDENTNNRFRAKA